MYKVTERVVINTGPLPGLVAALGNLSILQKLFGEILVPEEVCSEMLKGKNEFGRNQFNQATFLEKGTKPTQISNFLRRALDSGEAAVIQTALDKSISLVCIDEAVGRRIARLHGLKLTGSLGILVAAKRNGLIDNVSHCVERMQRAGIWLSDSLVAQVLQFANEQR